MSMFAAPGACCSAWAEPPLMAKASLAGGLMAFDRGEVLAFAVAVHRVVMEMKCGPPLLLFLLLLEWHQQHIAVVSASPLVLLNSLASSLRPPACWDATQHGHALSNEESK